MNGRLFEEKMAVWLRKKYGRKYHIIVGKNGIDIIMRSYDDTERIYIECKLDKNAILGQVTLKVVNGVLQGISQRSRASPILIKLIQGLLEENNLIGMYIEDIVNTSYKSKKNLGQIHHINRMRERATPGKKSPKKYIIVGLHMYDLNEYDPGETRIRIRRKGSRFVVVVEAINHRSIEPNSADAMKNVARKIF